MGAHTTPTEHTTTTTAEGDLVVGQSVTVADQLAIGPTRRSFVAFIVSLVLVVAAAEVPGHY